MTNTLGKYQVDIFPIVNYLQWLQDQNGVKILDWLIKNVIPFCPISNDLIIVNSKSYVYSSVVLEKGLYLHLLGNCIKYNRSN